MLKALSVLMTFWSLSAFAIPCNCEVRVHPPMTGSATLGVTVLGSYRLESFDTFKVKNQLQCRESCLERFQSDFPVAKLNESLVSHSQKLISEGSLGYNCTGLTTLKYPVRVKANLGRLGLGTVVDQIEIVTHEQGCFNE